MVLAADDVADLEVDVIRAGSEMVGGHAVAAQQSEVFNVVGGLDLVSIDGVAEPDALTRSARHAEAQRERLSGGSTAVAFLARKLAHAGVEEPGLVGAGFLAVTGVSGSEVPVGEPSLEDRFGNLAVEAQALGLL